MASKKTEENISRGDYVESLQLKKLGIRRICKSFKFSFDGLKYAFTHEQSLALHLIVMILIITLGIVFKLDSLEWIVSFVIGALLIVAELFNTSIEATVDLVTGKYHPLAKVAKDTASAACFIADTVATVIWLSIFIPKIIAFFK